MTVENEFEPHLGRMRSTDGKRARKYLGRVLAAANLARGGSAILGARGKLFSGSRIGRGAGIGRLLTTPRRDAASAARRVVIKASIVKLAGKGAAAASAHLRYLQRDGTTREGEPGSLYGADNDAVDGKAFRERGLGDRHQFRFIVSAEDGAAYDDLKPLTRRLMAQVEEDLGTKLDWVAVDHFNTGHPHTHIVVRGRDERGKDLVIARNYLTVGMRERASALVSLDLGPRSAREIETALRAEVEQERLTSLDRGLLCDSDSDRTVAATASNALGQALRAGRLAKLKKLGLAEPIGGPRWRLAPGFGETLQRMGERGDIIRLMQREFATRGLDRAPADQAIYDPSSSEARPLIGRVMSRGLADEYVDRHYLIVDGIDGRSHFVAVGKGETLEVIPEGAVVRIEPLRAQARAVDRTVAAVAAANGGRYDIDAHLRYDPSATEAFAETHIRRLEAMRRLTGGVTREPNGQWIVAGDHVDRATEYGTKLLTARPVAVEILSSIPLPALAVADAATWLDRTLVIGIDLSPREAGFGAELRDAQNRRRQWLLDQGLAEDAGDTTIYRADLLATLQRRELMRISAQMSKESGLAFVEPMQGVRVEGILKHPVELISGRFAIIEKSREFTLVPWKPALYRQIGKPVSGIMRGDTISWSIGRNRGGISF